MSSAHFAPMGVTPHAPFTHAPLKQSASLVQVVLHAPVAASHAYGAHVREGNGMIGHVPFPSHVKPPLGMFPLHCAATQTVPAGSGPHSPALPGSAQLTQLPSHAEVQHTPSAQKPLRQSIPSTHTVLVPTSVSPPSG